MSGFVYDSVPSVGLWSSHVVPRPSEWKANVIVGGYTSLDRETNYTPPVSLQNFLGTDEQIVVVSFGSMTILDPAMLISMVSYAVRRRGARAVICRSWPKKREMGLTIPPNVFLCDSIPHNWLLPHADGFVHHGGSGHTAAGLRAGIPMLLIPFFLDQNYWASRVTELGLGPPPLEIRTLTAEKLDTSFGDLLSGKYEVACKRMAIEVQAEGDGADTARDEIIRQLNAPEINKRCSLIPALRADWYHEPTGILLSGAAAASLINSEVLAWDDLHEQNNIDWDERRRLASSSFAWVKVLCALADFLSTVLDALLALLIHITGLFDPGMAAESADLKSANPNPVYQARIRRSEFDWRLIIENMDKDKARALDTTLAEIWRAQAATKFYELFRIEDRMLLDG